MTGTPLTVHSPKEGQGGIHSVEYRDNPSTLEDVIRQSRIRSSGAVPQDALSLQVPEGNSVEKDAE